MFLKMLNRILFCSLFASAATAAIQTTTTKVMRGLLEPWDIAFAADGSMFYTEKCGGVTVKKLDGSTVRLIGASTPTATMLVADDLFCTGESGYSGLALDPDFANNGFVYVYAPALKDNNRFNHVVRFKVDPTYSIVSDRVDIIADIPYQAVENIVALPGSNSGGSLRFGPDGYLYVGTGDNQVGAMPQDLLVLGGKVLRVDRNGNAAPGNNTPAGGDERIYSYGHRNVLGITFSPTTGQAVIAEDGSAYNDEVTAIVAGGNGGWDPKAQAGVVCPDNYCGDSTNKATGQPTPMTDKNKFTNAVSPLFTNANSEGMGPITYLTGAQWGALENMAVVGYFDGMRIDVVNTGALNTAEPLFSPGLPGDEHIRALTQGPDGFLYVATDEGNIFVVKPQ